MGERTLIHYSITLSLPLIIQCYKYFWCCVGKKRCENGGCFPPVKDDPNHSSKTLVRVHVATYRTRVGAVTVPFLWPFVPNGENLRRSSLMFSRVLRLTVGALLTHGGGAGLPGCAR
jgi:hypothetical protein